MADLTAMSDEDVAAMQALGSHDANRERARRTQARIEAARQGRTLDRAFAAVERLNRSGWRVRVWDADHGVYVGGYGPYLCVDGTDNYGDRFHGTVDARGDLRGEPSD